MTESQKIELCKRYNNSDIDCFEYMKQFCGSEQMEILNRLIYLNTETAIGFGDEDYTNEELEEYYTKKWVLLNHFGLENKCGDAYFNGKFYQ